jgi:hypothetical protein
MPLLAPVMTATRPEMASSRMPGTMAQLAAVRPGSDSHVPYMTGP